MTDEERSAKLKELEQTVSTTTTITTEDYRRLLQIEEAAKLVASRSDWTEEILKLKEVLGWGASSESVAKWRADRNKNVKTLNDRLEESEASRAAMNETVGLLQDLLRRRDAEVARIVEKVRATLEYGVSDPTLSAEDLVHKLMARYDSARVGWVNARKIVKDLCEELVSRVMSAGSL